MKLEFKKEAKKTAIVCYGVRISMDATNVRSVDLYYMREYLLNVLGRSEVDFVCRKLKKEADMDFYKNITDVDLNDYDEVFIYNCTYNLFGGVFFQHAYDTFNALYDYEGDELYWLLLDPKMPPLDYGKFVKSRIKDGHINVDGNLVEITPEYCDKWSEKVWNKTKVAFNGFDYDKYYNQYMGEINKKKKINPINVLKSDYDWAEFCLFEYYAINEKLDKKLETYDSEKEYDLVYFGNNRSTARNKLVKNMYNNDLKKLCVGYELEVPNCEYLPYIKHDELFKTIGEKCLCTLVVGDPLHNDNIRTPRFFEAMLLDTVAFVYIDFDPEKKYVTNDFLKDFIYVSTKEELEKKVEMVKNDKELYKRIVKLEREDILNQFEKIYKKN